MDNTKESKGTIIERTEDNSTRDENGNLISYCITLLIKDLLQKSVYFIAYPEGKLVNDDRSILNVARLGVIPLGK
jgi:hypothetical protein